jgi:hypothetical protein
MKEPYMKRGGFWMTTVATGLAVVGLMTVGRAALNSQGVLFLQGQMKIATGDTDSGLKLLAAASSQPETGPSQTVSSESASAAAEKPCNRKTAVAQKVNRPERTSLKLKPAPEPTLANMAMPSVPMPPMVQVHYAQDGMAYIPTAQREMLRARQAEIQRAQRIQEQKMKESLQEVSFHYGPNALPNAEQIRVQVQKDLGAWAQ